MVIAAHLTHDHGQVSVEFGADILRLQCLRSWLDEDTPKPPTGARLHRFIVLRQGGGCFIADGENFALAPTTLINIPLAAEFWLDLTPDAQGDVLTVPVHELPEVMRMSVAQPTRLAYPFAVNCSTDILGCIEQIRQELASQAVFRTAGLRAQATWLAICAVRLAEAQSGSGHSPTRSKYLARILPIIRAHIHQRFGVEDYARLAGVSAVHFNRLCRQMMHCSAHELIENIRFQEACRLLTHSDKSIAEIGFALGYDDPSYFSRAFRRNTGETPSRYRIKRRDTGSR